MSQQRQADPDHHAGEHADKQRRGDRRDRDPEVEALDPGQAAHLWHVHHPQDHRLDDQGPEHRLGQI